MLFFVNRKIRFVLLLNQGYIRKNIKLIIFLGLIYFFNCCLDFVPSFSVIEKSANEISVFSTVFYFFHFFDDCLGRLVQLLINHMVYLSLC